jgi:hypothetical protein
MAADHLERESIAVEESPASRPYADAWTLDGYDDIEI